MDSVQSVDTFVVNVMIVIDTVSVTQLDHCPYDHYLVSFAIVICHLICRWIITSSGGDCHGVPIGCCNVQDCNVVYSHHWARTGRIQLEV